MENTGSSDFIRPADCFCKSPRQSHEGACKVNAVQHVCKTHKEEPGIGSGPSSSIYGNRKAEMALRNTVM